MSQLESSEATSVEGGTRSVEDILRAMENEESGESLLGKAGNYMKQKVKSTAKSTADKVTGKVTNGITDTVSKAAEDSLNRSDTVKSAKSSLASGIGRVVDAFFDEDAGKNSSEKTEEVSVSDTSSSADRSISDDSSVSDSSSSSSAKQTEESAEKQTPLAQIRDKLEQNMKSTYDKASEQIKDSVEKVRQAVDSHDIPDVLSDPDNQPSRKLKEPVHVLRDTPAKQVDQAVDTPSDTAKKKYIHIGTMSDILSQNDQVAARRAQGLKAKQLPIDISRVAPSDRQTALASGLCKDYMDPIIVEITKKSLENSLGTLGMVDRYVPAVQKTLSNSRVVTMDSFDDITNFKTMDIFKAKDDVAVPDVEPQAADSGKDVRDMGQDVSEPVVDKTDKKAKGESLYNKVFGNSNPIGELADKVAENDHDDFFYN